MSARLFLHNDYCIASAGAEAAQAIEPEEVGSVRQASRPLSKNVWDSTDALLMAKPCRFRQISETEPSSTGD
jgi:hypothetical protein